MQKKANIATVAYDSEQLPSGFWLSVSFGTEYKSYVLFSTFDALCKQHNIHWK